MERCSAYSGKKNNVLLDRPTFINGKSITKIDLISKGTTPYGSGVVSYLLSETCVMSVKCINKVGQQMHFIHWPQVTFLFSFWYWQANPECSPLAWGTFTLYCPAKPLGHDIIDDE